MANVALRFAELAILAHSYFDHVLLFLDTVLKVSRAVHDAALVLAIGLLAMVSQDILAQLLNLNPVDGGNVALTTKTNTTVLFKTARMSAGL